MKHYFLILHENRTQCHKTLDSVPKFCCYRAFRAREINSSSQETINAWLLNADTYNW